MVMNKKEQAELAAAKKAVVVARALRWTEPVAPDVPPPVRSGLTTGYLFNANCGVVTEACSSSVGHARGRTDKTTTQGYRYLYSSKLLALRAMRHEVERECAKKLADIDMQIQAEQQP